MTRFSILIVSQVDSMCKLLEEFLLNEEFATFTARNAEEFHQQLKQYKPDLLVIDLPLEGIKWTQMRSAAEEAHPEVGVLILAPDKSFCTGLKGVRKQALELLFKPVTREEFLFHVDRCIENIELRQQFESRNLELQRMNIQLEDALDRRRQLESRLIESNDRFRLLSTQDGLTGVANRRSFDATYLKEWRRSVREKSPLSLIMLDIDHFKLFNDNYGHPAGDMALKQVAKVIDITLRRPGDMVARYGGEEFVILLPDTDEKGAFSLAVKIRTNVETMGIHHASSPTHKTLTVSLGVATMKPSTHSKEELQPEQLVQAADRALYQAKSEGRNRVVAAEVVYSL